MVREVAAGILTMAGLTGCYLNMSSRIIGPPEIIEAPAIPAPGGATGSAGAALVSVDGWLRDLRGEVACTRYVDVLSIAVGEPNNGVAVTMSPDAAEVEAVRLGKVAGVLMGYQQGAPGGSAAATKHGSLYTITGTATGVNKTDLMQPFIRPFEITVNCP